MQLPSNAHILSADEVATRLEVSAEKGLTESEVYSRRGIFGTNELKQAEERSLAVVFLLQFKSPVVYLLLVAAGVSFIFNNPTEAFAILIVILVNTLIGFWMEAQAIKSMIALRRLEKVMVKVWRAATLIEVRSEELVPGDVLYVEAGDLVGADARLLSEVQLETDESALTGESLPVLKSARRLPTDTIVAERNNMIFKGTVVTHGNGKAIVTRTGMETELGGISAMVQSAKPEAIPLNVKLEKFSRNLVLLAVLIVLPLIVVGLMEGRDIQLMIKTGIALAVAAIPEGLPIVATIALARGMLKLAKHQVIVKKLAAVETLGSTNVIFTDKTGTLTQNKLQVTTLCFPQHTLEIEWDEMNKAVSFRPFDLDAHARESLQKLLTVAVMCNNAYFSEANPVGDPLEVALLKIGEYHRTGFLEEVHKIFPRIYEHPFDSSEKIMGTIHAANGSYYAAVKGAIEGVLKNSEYILRDGETQLLTKADKKEWLERNDLMAGNGLRVLAFAYQDRVPNVKNFIHDLVFVGLAGFQDPPREEVRQSIQACREAGIRVVMVTGDHPETAKSIALKIGLVDDPEELVMHGSKLKPWDRLSAHEMAGIMEAKIFSRLSPGQKLELVELYQQKGWIVGMTGDGVNDAPALKKAEIGIAMGKRGTQVAREAADMVLQDDSFASIARAVKYGRVIYDNIRTFIIYLLSCNLSEILIVATAGFMNLSLPLQPLQILFLNIVTDVFPALALGMNEGSNYVMKRRPRHSNEPMLNRKNWFSIFAYSFFITISVLIVFLYSHFYENSSGAISNNVAFFTLAFAQLLHPLNLASAKTSFFENEVTRNLYLWIAVAFCTALIFFAYFVKPFSTVLSMQTLPSEIWFLIGAGSVLPLLLIQIAKRTGLVA
jgi:P-type Ca2+ transporter type 2C